ncbi:MAG: hypothetical protein KA163_14670 [Bacteroidia bacterium]|nr:hypothetical protein [Bacteroidia bacterium]
MLKTKKYFLFTILLCEISFFSFSQIARNKHFGFNVGAVIAVGNRFHRMGIVLQGYYVYDFVQINAEARVYHNLKNLGPKFVYNEAVTSAGAVIAFGDKQKYFNPFLSAVSNQTKHKYAIAYSYNAYFNKIRTKQSTGTIALQFGNVSLISENDLYAHPTLDRFRTGAFLIQYQHKNIFQAAINCTMWTGKMGNPIRDSKDFPSVGYMDTVGGVYTNYSHGLLSAQFKFNIGYGQNAQLNFGVDAEQVRNAVQNRLIHDMIFLPRKWYKPINCHIPMLDEDDNQFLYQSGQKIKKPSLYLNAFSNPSLFY